MDCPSQPWVLLFSCLTFGSLPSSRGIWIRRSFRLADLGRVYLSCGVSDYRQHHRLFGPGYARQLVYVGFALGVLLTLTDALVTAAARANVISATVLEALFNDPDARSMLRVAIGSGNGFSDCTID